MVSQYMHAPQTRHLNVVHPILKHLKGSAGQETLYTYHDCLNIEACSDVDWVGSKSDR